MTRFACWIASMGPCGYFPIAPATFASLVIAACYAFLPPVPMAVQVVLLVGVTLVAFWSAGRAETVWGHDARRIVIDEGAGMAVTLFLMPPGMTTAVLAFVTFRIFDIWKPFPGRRAEALPGGYGVVTDDLVAGVYAHLVTRLALYYVG